MIMNNTPFAVIFTKIFDGNSNNITKRLFFLNFEFLVDFLLAKVVTDIGLDPNNHITRSIICIPAPDTNE